MERPLAALAGLVARLRHARALHPVGTTYDASAQLDRPLGSLPAGDHRVLVRLSRGGGLPTWLPDVGGIAVRFPDAGGDGRHQDLLLSSSFRAPLLRRLPWPARRLERRSYSSLTTFRVGGEQVVLGARFTAPRTIEVQAGRTLLRVLLGPAVPATLDAMLDLDPWHDGAGVVPVGRVNRWRRAAYAASRRGRGAPAPAPTLPGP